MSSASDLIDGFAGLIRQDHPPRKKLALPPVKLACLSCRKSRTRCDGTDPCTSCVTKGADCAYQPSRRGGSRNRSKPTRLPGQSSIRQPRPALPLGNFVDPGAGLSQIEEEPHDSDFLFDSLFMDDVHQPKDSNLRDPTEHASPRPMVRLYRSDHAILHAYYIWIHPFFPILPPPPSGLIPYDQALSSSPSHGEQAFEPCTPLTLAISAILALVPCAEDGDHRDQESVAFRRHYAQAFSRAALECMEEESEIPVSSTDPPKALMEPTDSPSIREPFHPHLSLDLESIVALDILSVYEYAQRGNIHKMRSRASQAFSDAMVKFPSHNTGTDDEDGARMEARRRVWWMTFVCVCQGSIVSNQAPSFNAFNACFAPGLPSLDGDPQAWPLFIQSQKAILAATEFVVELNSALKSNRDLKPLFEKMKHLDAMISPLIDQSDACALMDPMIVQSQSVEGVLSRSLRVMARIKLNSARIKVHRFCAFYDVAVFSGKHCDLKSVKDDNLQQSMVWSFCGCNDDGGNVSGSPRGSPMLDSTFIQTSTPSLESSPNSQTAAGNLPFSSHSSAKVCLRSALNIAQAFDDLPYPCASGIAGDDLPFMSPTSLVLAPRTMPSFACCAMQAAYSLFMIHQKTKSMYPTLDGNTLVNGMLRHLKQGVESISAALDNYSTAFEALGGMRDEIKLATETWMFEAIPDSSL